MALFHAPAPGAVWAAVTAAMAAPRPSRAMRCVAHPPTVAAPWTFTVTVEYQVGAEYVRAHVHLTPMLGGMGFLYGPGHYWVEGLMGHQAATPAWVVNEIQGAIRNPHQEQDITFGCFHGEDNPEDLYSGPDD